MAHVAVVNNRVGLRAEVGGIFHTLGIVNANVELLTRVEEHSAVERHDEEVSAIVAGKVERAGAHNVAILIVATGNDIHSYVA